MTGSPRAIGHYNPFDEDAVDVFAALPMRIASSTADLLARIAEFSAGIGGTILLKAGLYETAAEIQLPAAFKPIKIVGQPWSYNNASAGTRIRATAAMRSVIAMLSTHHRLESIRIDANRLASYGVFGTTCASCDLDHVMVERARYDGVHADPTGSVNNNSVALKTVWSVANGTLYVTAGILAEFMPSRLAAEQCVTVTGTASTTAGSSTITIAGSSTDFSTLGIRKDDFVRAGTRFYQVESVTATTIVTQNRYVPVATEVGLDFAIGSGFGVNLARSANNNIWRAEKGLYRGNAAAGFNIQGVFGATLDSVQMDNNGFVGAAVGRTDSGSATVDCTLIAPYLEGNLMAQLWVHQVINFVCLGPTIQDTVPFIAPVEDTGGRPRGVMIYDGRIFKLNGGWECDFVVQLTNNAPIQHRIVSDTTNGTKPQFLADVVTGASSGYNTTPSVAAGVDFVAGVGIDNASKHRLILNNGVNSGSVSIGVVFAGQTGADHWDVQSTIVENGTGVAGLTVEAARVTVNVNGVSRGRCALIFKQPDGTTYDLTTIPAGKTLAARVRGYLKR